ncbi:hypothetical protein MKX03_023749 [Papaver bracteatum]|nr:hypothetical protein MKX03_023749 [Papaver bracteatum]
MKKAIAAAKKAEIKRLAELEAKELEKAAKKSVVTKVTEAELQKRREEEENKTKKKQIRTAAEEEYERMVLVRNTNRDESVIQANTIEDAIATIGFTNKRRSAASNSVSCY